MVFIKTCTAVFNGSITLVWKLLYVKVRTVLESTDSQLSYEPYEYKKKVKIRLEVYQSRFLFVTVTVTETFSLLSRFLAILRQFKSKSHIQGHPRKVETQSFHLTPSLIEFQAILLEILVLKKGHKVCQPAL